MRTLTVSRILLVDDDATMRLIVRRIFAREAPMIEIVEAFDGEEAIVKLGAGEFDCVLSDYRMGAVTGTDVLAFALKNHPRTTRILMSGFADPRIAASARERAQIHEFIEKPMTTAELSVVIREVVLERYFVAECVRPDAS